jgi:hypothetical protein
MMQGIPMHSNFIKNASMVKSDPQSKIQAGILRGTLNEFQKTSVDGLLKGGMPEHSSSPSGHKPNIHSSGKAPATQLVDGMMPYQGSSKGQGKKSKK